MEDHTNLAESIRVLADQYLATEISLNAFVHRSEATLEQGKSALPLENHKWAMNCIYILEEISALLLDEGRAMRADERSRVTTELERLLSFVDGVGL